MKIRSHHSQSDVRLAAVRQVKNANSGLVNPGQIRIVTAGWLRLT